jgi:hypothetical protein
MSGNDSEAIGKALLALVPTDGSTIGNTRLRRMIGEALGREIDKDAYFEVQRALVEAGTLVTGPGRGGSVRLAQPGEAAADPAAAATTGIRDH